VDVTRVGRVRVPVAHNAQDAGKIRLQHLDNNHPDANAKDPHAVTAARRAPTSARSSSTGPMLRAWRLAPGQHPRIGVERSLYPVAVVRVDVYVRDALGALP